MANKTVQEKLDYEKFKTVDAVDDEVRIHKDIVCRKVRQHINIKDEKKTAVGAYNEQLKEIEEELDHEIKTLDALNDRRRALSK
jgi:hypothetical protein